MKKHLLSVLVLSSVVLSTQAQNSVSVDLTNKLLVNADFELVDTSTVAGIEKIVEANGDAAVYSAAYNKVPYGWSCNFDEFGGKSRGVNADVQNPHGTTACWFNQSTFPVGWKLYQTIPASKLEPGLYKISCLMWVEYGRKGTVNSQTTVQNGYGYAEKMGAACLFANNNVQYYGISRDYNKNLTSTDEDVTYANYVPGTGGRAKLRPMVVYVNLQEGQDLSLGIRTASVDSAGAVRGNGAGWFRTDNFKIEKIVAKPDMTPDEFSQKALVNNSFDLSPDGTPSSAQIVGGDNNPYGWYHEGTADDYGIHPNFVWAYEGTNACWFNSKAVPFQDFSLYQIVGSDNLTPGVYEVSCRLWQPTDRFGQCRIYGFNGDKSYVQYYSDNTKYDLNLVTGEEISYAGYPGWSDSFNTRDRQLHEMFVNVPVHPGQDLELGVKSGSMRKDGTVIATNMDGQFHVDYFRTYKVANLPVSYKAAEANTVEPTGYPVEATLECSLVNNQWNTICLPFDLNAADIQTIFGKDTKVAAFESAVADNLNFNTVAAMMAGVPYLVKPTNALPSPMTIDDVKITASMAQTIAKGDFSFKGVFSPESVTASDQTKQLINADNTISPVTSDGSLNAFTAFVQSNTTATAKSFTIDGDQSTGIHAIANSTTTDTPMYNLAGQRINQNAKGVVITNGKKLVKK